MYRIIVETKDRETAEFLERDIRGHCGGYDAEVKFRTPTNPNGDRFEAATYADPCVHCAKWWSQHIRDDVELRALCP